MREKSPNIQNISPKTDEGKRIRDAFVKQIPFVDVDYSTIEQRILAQYAKEQMV